VAGWRITGLTQEQRARCAEFAQKWTATALSTEPADRPRATAAIHGLYRLAKLSPPQVIWLPCPLSAALSATAFAALRNAGIAAGGMLGGDEDNAIKLAVSACRAKVTAFAAPAVCAAVSGAVHVGEFAGDRSRLVRNAMDRALDFSSLGPLEFGVFRAVIGAARAAMYGAMRASPQPLGAIVDSVADSTVKVSIPPALMGGSHAASDAPLCETICPAVRAAVRSAIGAEASFSTIVVRNVEEDSFRQDGGLSLTCKAGLAYQFSRYETASSCAELDYFHSVLGLQFDRSFLDLADARAGFCWFLRDVCFASERARFAHCDDYARPHCETGPSIGFPSGWSLWHWHGVEVPQEVVEQPGRLSVARIESERNIEVRRVMIERYGLTRFVVDAGAQLIHQDQRGLAESAYRPRVES
jgi:hypothetical protein